MSDSQPELEKLPAESRIVERPTGLVFIHKDGTEKPLTSLVTQDRKNNGLVGRMLRGLSRAAGVDRVA